MLASITPLGERSRRQQWAITVAALIVGSAAAGAAVGAALAATGRLLPLGASSRLVLLLGIAAVAVVLELRPFGVRLPTHRRQVDESWLLRYRGWVYGIGFGGQLGVGVWTIVATSAVYVAFVAELLARDVAAGLAIGATSACSAGRRSSPPFASIRRSHCSGSTVGFTGPSTPPRSLRSQPSSP